MKNFGLSLCILFLSMGTSLAQSLLEGWEGDYKGQMILGYTNGHRDSLDVTFEFKPIEKDSSWTYKLVFDSPKFGQVVKDYEIHRVGNSTTDFVLDEKDGIIIEMSWMDDCFYDMFEVADNFFISTLCKFGNDLRFDLFMSPGKPSSQSISEEDEEGNVFEVNSYKPSLHQTVVLVKQDTRSDEEKKLHRQATEAYEKLVDAADEAYALKKYDRALELYTRAIMLMPSNEYAQRMKEKTEKRLAE